MDELIGRGRRCFVFKAIQTIKSCGLARSFLFLPLSMQNGVAYDTYLDLNM